MSEKTGKESQYSFAPLYLPVRGWGCDIIAMGVSSPKLSVFATDNGIKWMLAPESHKAFLNLKFSMVQGMVKLQGSRFSLVSSYGSLHYMKFTIASVNFLFLLRMFFRNLP